MTTHDLEERLGASLRAHAEHLHDTPLTLDGVRRRATSIRRRRRTATGAGLVAAAAVVAGLALPTSSLWRDSAPPVPPAQAPAAPAASVLHDGVVTRPDGSTVTVPFANEDVGPTTYGVLTDGRVVAAVSEREGRARVVVVGADGSVEAEHPALQNAVTMGQGDRTVAWVGPGHRVQVLESGHAEPVTLAGIPMPGEGVGSVDAVIGSDCADGGCRVLAGDYNTTTVSITGPEPARDLDLPRPMRVTDVSPDGSLWAVNLPARDDLQFPCVGLYDPARGAVVARTCTTFDLTFSPDGQQVMGWLGDNNTLSHTTVLDLRLEEVATVTRAGRILSKVAWAGPGELYVVSAEIDSTGWRLEREAVDGSGTELVAGPVDGPSPELGSAYELSD